MTVLERSTQITTATDMLQKWRNANKYLGDLDGGGPEPADVYKLAYELNQFLLSAGITHEEIGADVAERNVITEHVLAHEDLEKAEEQGRASMDPPDDYC